MISSSLLALALSGCGDGGIGRYFSYEERMDRASPPDTVEELKARCKRDTGLEPPRTPVFQTWMTDKVRQAAAGD